MAAPASDTASSVVVPPWKPAGNGSVNAESLEAWVEAGLLRHRNALDGLLAVEGVRTIENTLRAYDDAVAELGAVGSLTGLMHSVYPDKPVRIRHRYCYRKSRRRA